MIDEKAFNLFDFGLKKGGKIQLYGDSSLDSDGNIISFETQMAIVSHFLHTDGSKFSEPFRLKGTELAKFWADWASGIQKEINIDASLAAEPSALERYLFHDVLAAPFQPVETPKFTVIDLFAGIGGFRMALQNLGGKCVFSSEWDSQAQRTYLPIMVNIPLATSQKKAQNNISQIILISCVQVFLVKRSR